jgi:hypothetical protein
MVRQSRVKAVRLTFVSRRPRRPEYATKTPKRIGRNMSRPRAADDFAAIRSRLEEPRREREAAPAAESELGQQGPHAQTPYWSRREISAGPGRVRPSGLTRS